MGGWSDTIKKADIFHQDQEVLLESGKRKLQSHFGVVLGFFMIVILVLYAYLKFDVMLSYKGNQISEPEYQNFFDNDYIFGRSSGWNVAFGLTAYDSSSDPEPFDRGYGEIGAYMKVWGEKDEDGNSVPTYFAKLKTRPCERNDINFEGKENIGKTTFFKPAPEFEYDAERFYDVLQCITDDPVLAGDYNSAKAIQLVITFTICRGRYYCKDEATIKEWLARKFILTMENHIYFDKQNVEDNGLKKQSVLVWNVLSPQIRTDYYNYVELIRTKLYDEIWDIGLRQVNHELFSVAPGPFRLWDFPDDVHLAITYEFNKDLQQVHRTVYSIMDLLGDLGGLASSVIALFTAFVIIFQYRAPISYLSQHTVLAKQGDEVKRVPIGFFGGIKLSLQRLICKCSCCHSKRDKLSHLADEAVKQDVKIVGWVKRNRMLKYAYSKLFSKEEWAQIEKEAMTRVLYIDEDEDKVKLATLDKG